MFFISFLFRAQQERQQQLALAQQAAAEQQKREQLQQQVLLEQQRRQQEQEVNVVDICDFLALFLHDVCNVRLKIQLHTYVTTMHHLVFR